MGPALRKITPGLSVITAALLPFALLAASPARAAQQTSPAPESNTAAAHVGKGYEALKDERYEEGAKEFQAALALEPRLTRARFQLAVCWFALGKMQDAQEAFARLEKETGGDSSVEYYLARLDMRQGDVDAAIWRLLRVVNDPPFPDTAYYLGAAYLTKREFKPAEKWLRVAAQAAPRDYRIPDHLARVYQREGRKAEAEQQFEISTRLRQIYDVANKQAVACSGLLETQSLEQARPACQELFDSNNPDKLLTLGMLYGQHGFYAEAVAPLAAAGRLDPDSYEIQHDLGLTYFRLRRYAEAREALSKSVALRPDFFGSNALLGATLYALGQDEAAYKVLSHAHALNPADPDTADLLFKEATILAAKEEKQNRYDAARDYLGKAAELQPENQAVRRRLAELTRRLSHTPEAKPAEKGSAP